MRCAPSNIAFQKFVVAAVLLLAASGTVFSDDKINYQDHILPVIENNCAKCHNSDKKKGDLDLTSYNGVMKGGGSGVAVIAGNPDGSKLYRAVTHAEDPTMPPKKSRLPDKELDLFKRWITGGLLEHSGSKAIAAKPAVDLTVKISSLGKPEGPPAMPGPLSMEPVSRATHGSAIVGLAASLWAPITAIGGQKQVLLYHTGSLLLLGILPYLEGQPIDLKFSRNGKLLIAGGGHSGKSGKVIVWDITNGERILSVGNEYDTVLASDMSPDQSRIALGGSGRLVKIYSTRDGELAHKLKKHTDWVTAIAFSPDGEILASADRNGAITLWDPDNGQELVTLAGHKSCVTSLCWRGDGKLLASSSEDGSIKLWEPAEGKQSKTWNAHPGGALCVSYTHDGRMVTCGRDNQVVLWDANGNKSSTFEFAGELPVRAAFNEDGSRVLASDWTGKVRVWKSNDKKLFGELPAFYPALGEQIAAMKTQQDPKKNHVSAVTTPGKIVEAHNRGAREKSQ